MWSFLTDISTGGVGFWVGVGCCFGFGRRGRCLRMYPHPPLLIITNIFFCLSHLVVCHNVRVEFSLVLGWGCVFAVRKKADVGCPLLLLLSADRLFVLGSLQIPALVRNLLCGALGFGGVCGLPFNPCRVKTLAVWLCGSAVAAWQFRSGHI